MCSRITAGLLEPFQDEMIEGGISLARPELATDG